MGYFRGCEESERVLESDIGFANQVKVHLSVNGMLFIHFSMPYTYSYLHPINHETNSQVVNNAIQHRYFNYVHVSD